MARSPKVVRWSSGALCRCAPLVLFAAVAFADDDAFAQQAGADGNHRPWHVEVVAPAADGAPDPWQARTILAGPQDDSTPWSEAHSVTWLAGFQREASHLGMGSEGNGSAQVPEERWPLAAGITRIVTTIPILGPSLRGLIGHPLDGIGDDTVASSEPGMAAPSDRASGEPARAPGELPAIDGRRASFASSVPCPHETCFGPSLIEWNPALAACTKDVRIGVIDTSFDLGHPAFKRLRVVRKEFIEGATPSDEDWHGTAILSLLAGDSASGTPGLVPDATFLLATVFRSDAQGNASADPARLLEALNWLDGLGVDIVNMSFAGPPDPRIARAIERMSFKGVIFVAAAGNMGPAADPSYPGAYPHVIAVTAVDREGHNYRNASRGDYIDLAAPGVDILTAMPNGKQGLQTGTSFAVPFVAAILATRAASDIVEGTEDLLLERISTRDLGQPGRDPVYGAGLVVAPQQCLGSYVTAKGSSGKGAEKPAKTKPAIKAGVASFRW